MELKEKVKHLKSLVSKIEQGIYYVETHVIPRLEADKKILSDVKRDLIKAEAELNAEGQAKVREKEGDVKKDVKEAEKKESEKKPE